MLRTEAARAVDEWLEQLSPELETLARDLGSDVRVLRSVSHDQAWPSYRLLRDTWGFGEALDPPLSVSLEWIRGRTTMRGDLTPYVGLRAWKGNALGAKLRANEELKKVRVARKDPSGTYWAAFRFVPPGPEFPESPEAAEAYREKLVAAVRDAWDAYAPFVERAI